MNKSQIKAQILAKKGKDLLSDIRELIMSNKNWIFYFIPPNLKSDSKNQPIKKYVTENPYTWEDDAYIDVLDFNGTSVHVHINLENGELVPQFYDRHIILEHFDRDVEYNKKAMDGELDEFLIKELNDEILYYKEQIEKAEKELSKLNENHVNLKINNLS